MSVDSPCAPTAVSFAVNTPTTSGVKETVAVEPRDAPTEKELPAGTAVKVQAKEVIVPVDAEPSNPTCVLTCVVLFTPAFATAGIADTMSVVSVAEFRGPVTVSLAVNVPAMSGVKLELTVVPIVDGVLKELPPGAAVSSHR